MFCYIALTIRIFQLLRAAKSKCNKVNVFNLPYIALKCLNSLDIKAVFFEQNYYTFNRTGVNDGLTEI